jgi:D-alanyl-D-alanine carboxypeptidase/D-alanyl-D-alanine-endopeptidase (penicillin-binding protein 4)
MRGHRRRAPSRSRVFLSLLAVLLVVSGGLVAAVVTYQQQHDGAPRTAVDGATTKPSASPAPVARTTAPAAWALTPSPAVVALSPSVRLPAGEKPTAKGLTAMLAPRLADPAFAGGSVSVVVGDPLTGAVLLNDGGTAGVLPASTAKLAVAAAALETLGPRHRLTTKATLAADGRLVLVGGGDPTLAGPKAVGRFDPGFPAPARLADLAARTASALKARGVTHVQLGYDDSLFTGPSTAPGWKPTYITEGDVAPVSALEVDEGQPDLTKPARANDPSAVAASDFAALLSANGVKVDGAPAPAPGSGPTLASVQSPTVAALIERMLGRSDNDLAKALTRHVAIALGHPATFAGGAQGVREVITKLGVEPDGFAMVDGSGLSRSDRVRPQALVQLVDALLSPAHPQFSPVLQGLPVAGFSGTLASRYASPPALAASGLVRAKTGTLDGVVALAGFTYDASGRVLSFAIVANGIANNATLKAEAALDRLSAGLAGCGCG